MSADRTLGSVTPSLPSPPWAPAKFHMSGCSVCGEPADLACSRCHTTSYCSNACQRSDWKKHKKVCGKSGEAAPASSAKEAQSELYECEGGAAGGGSAHWTEKGGDWLARAHAALHGFEDALDSPAVEGMALHILKPNQAINIDALNCSLSAPGSHLAPADPAFHVPWPWLADDYEHGMSGNPAKPSNSTRGVGSLTNGSTHASMLPLEPLSATKMRGGAGIGDAGGAGDAAGGARDGAAGKLELEGKDAGGDRSGDSSGGSSGSGGGDGGDGGDGGGGGGGVPGKRGVVAPPATPQDTRAIYITVVGDASYFEPAQGVGAGMRSIRPASAEEASARSLALAISKPTVDLAFQVIPTCDVVNTQFNPYRFPGTPKLSEPICSITLHPPSNWKEIEEREGVDVSRMMAWSATAMPGDMGVQVNCRDQGSGYSNLSKGESGKSGKISHQPGGHVRITAPLECFLAAARAGNLACMHAFHKAGEVHGNAMGRLAEYGTAMESCKWSGRIPI